jgi:hypothetical protein
MGNPPLQKFRESCNLLKRRAAAGRVLTRADLVTILQSPDLTSIQVHCIACPNADSKRKPRDRKFNVTLSASKFGASVDGATIKRYRTRSEIVELLEAIEAMEEYVAYSSANFQVYILRGGTYQDGIGNEILDICELVRYCSVNFQNVRRSFVRDKITEIDATVHFYSRYSPKSEFAAAIGKAFNCHQRLVDINSTADSVQIRDFVVSTCDIYGFNPWPSLTRAQFRELARLSGEPEPSEPCAIISKIADTVQHSPQGSVMERLGQHSALVADLTLATKDLTADIRRLTRECVERGLPMLLTLSAGESLVNAHAYSRESDPLLLMLFPMTVARDLVLAAREKTAPITKQIIALLKPKSQVLLPEIEAVSTVIREFIRYRYQDLRLTTLFEISKHAQSVMRGDPIRNADAIKTRFDSVLEFALQRILETTLAHDVAFWQLEPDENTLVRWSSKSFPLRGIGCLPPQLRLSRTDKTNLIPSIASRAMIVSAAEGKAYYIPDVQNPVPLRTGRSQEERNERPIYLERHGLMDLAGAELEKWELRYRSILWLPIFFNDVPMGCLQLFSNLANAFPIMDRRYIHQIAEAVETVIENLYRRNDFQWVIDRLHTLQNLHDVKNILDNCMAGGTPEQVQQLRRYLFVAPRMIPISRDTSTGMEVPPTGGGIHSAIRTEIDAMMGSSFDEHRKAVHDALVWNLPMEMVVSRQTAESIAVIATNFLANMALNIQDQAIKFATEGRDNGVQKAWDRLFVYPTSYADRGPSGWDSSTERPVDPTARFVTIRCETGGLFDPSDLAQIGIAPLPREEDDGLQRMGMFLVGALARINGGVLYIDREPPGREPPEKRGRSDMRVIRVTIPM